LYRLATMTDFPHEYLSKSSNSVTKDESVCVGLVVDGVLNAEVLEAKANEFVLERWWLPRGSLNTKVRKLFYFLMLMIFALIIQKPITYIYNTSGNAILIYQYWQDGQFQIKKARHAIVQSLTLRYIDRCGE
jgi:hypothetical protein